MNVGLRQRVLGGSALVTILVASMAPRAEAVLPAAEALFQEGRQRLAEGNLPEACALFAESYALDASSGTLLNLALCHEKQGKTATAWAEYRGAARLARSQGRGDRAEAADAKAATLEGRLAQLTFAADKVVPGLRIVSADDAWGEGGVKVGITVPIDPGIHHFTVSAPGFRSWVATVDSKEAEHQTLTIPELAPTPPSPAITGGGQTPPRAVLVGVPSSSPEPSRSKRLSLYLGIGGGGLLVGGVVAWSVAYGKLQSAKDACNPGPGCADYDSRVSAIETAKWIAVGSWIAGGALVAASGLQYWLRERKAPMTVAIDPIGRGLALAASF